ncbi:MAG: hypothetical protein QXL82_02940 [Candidatus Aenigmatarchaeota archaeon]
MVKKLISTFLATIILVALVVAIGIVLYMWFSGYITSPVKESVPIFEAQQRCAESYLDIEDVKINPPNNIVVTVFYVRGKEGLYDFIFEILTPNELIKLNSSDFTNKNPMQPGMTYSFNLFSDRDISSATRIKVFATCLENIKVSAEKKI